MIKIMGMLALALFAIVTATTAQSAPVAKELRTTDFSSQGAVNVPAVQKSLAVDPNNPNKGTVNVPAVQKNLAIDPNNPNKGAKKLKTKKSGTGMVGVDPNNPNKGGGVNVPAVQKGCKAGAVGCPSDPSAQSGPSPHMNPARMDPPRMSIPSGMGGGVGRIR